MRPIRVAFVSPELSPWAKAGGLADVASALPEALAALGCEMKLFVPLHACVDPEVVGARPRTELRQVPLDDRAQNLSFNGLVVGSADLPLETIFIQCAPVFERPGGIYTNESDEHRRWLVLCRAVLESCQRMQWGPDVLHLNDWPTALLSLLLKSNYGWDELFKRTRTLLTIHNLGYQGVFPARILPELGLGGNEWRLHQDDLHAGAINFLKNGLLWADRLSTVSPTYAREILGPEQGQGLQEVLLQRQADLVGILNGVDVRRWNPRHDPLIPFRYSEKSLWRKRRGKVALMERMGLAIDGQAPLLGVVARLTVQKGLDLMEAVLPALLQGKELRLVVLGSGLPADERFFASLAARHPQKVAFVAGFDEGLAHWIEAGSDIFLMPSHYEPCGLNQMYSMIYGTLPLVRRTGGLADTVEQVNAELGSGTGFLFDGIEADAFRDALLHALHCYEDRALWKRLVQNAMQRDWSWESSARRYLTLYESMREP